MVGGALITDGAIAYNNIARLDLFLECSPPGHQNHLLRAHDRKLLGQFHHHGRAATEACQHCHPAPGLLHGVHIRIHGAGSFHGDSPAHTMWHSALQAEQHTLRYYLGHSSKLCTIGDEFVCRRLLREGSELRLRASDPAQADIVAGEGVALDVWGVVTSVIKLLPV